MTRAEQLIDALQRLGYSAAEYVVDQTGDELRLIWRGGTGPSISEVIAKPLPKQASKWTPAEFRDRFTPDELVRIHRLAGTDDFVCLLEITLFTASAIWSNSPAVIDGLRLLVSRRVLTQERADAILG